MNPPLKGGLLLVMVNWSTSPFPPSQFVNAFPVGGGSLETKLASPLSHSRFFLMLNLYCLPQKLST